MKRVALALLVLILLGACSALGILTRSALSQALAEEGIPNASAVARRVEERASGLSDQWWQNLIGGVLLATLGGSGAAVGYTRYRRGSINKRKGVVAPKQTKGST